ncbi:hypothetical protein [Agromyces protaetiae]|uniref:hypothetical protein n=1 Tax=Agromyces protaetiae TaxID=2509455 RepID=UPI0013ED3C71|nr:hypothetical protein [Agromyces protaetiae]
MGTTEKTIKIDEPTARLVDDLAYLFRSTKKSIVRDAMLEFAAARRPERELAATEGRVTIDSLTLRERLALRRPELLREFARNDATEVRVFELDVADAEPVLLVVTDVVAGNGVEVILEEVARGILLMPIEVISMTRMRLRTPERLPELYARSRPL